MSFLYECKHAPAMPIYLSISLSIYTTTSIQALHEQNRSHNQIIIDHLQRTSRLRSWYTVYPDHSLQTRYHISCSTSCCHGHVRALSYSQLTTADFTVLGRSSCFDEGCGQRLALLWRCRAFDEAGWLVRRLEMHYGLASFCHGNCALSFCPAAMGRGGTVVQNGWAI